MLTTDEINQGLQTIKDDQRRLQVIQDYLRGNHVKPYMPEGANAEYSRLAEKAITNWMPTIVSTPARQLYVDNFRRTESTTADASVDSPEMRHWQVSGMDALQLPLHREAIASGAAYTLTADMGKGVRTVGLSPRTTVALFDNPASDLDPRLAVHVHKQPKALRGGGVEPGTVWAFDEEYFYRCEWDGSEVKAIAETKAHLAGVCPVSRFAPWVDLDGNTIGLIEPVIPIQDRINQTIFDLLMVQTFSSFEVRTVTGMAPPLQHRWNPDTQVMEVVVDEHGQPIPDKIFLNAGRFMFSDNENSKFGSLPGGKMEGFIAASELAIQQLSALSQVPPHYLLGKIANVSAEALKAAETALSRMVEEIRHPFGEAHERNFRIAATLNGDKIAAGDDFGEVVWRDMGVSSLAQSADALGKFADQLGIPKRGLWSRVPGVTKQEIVEWNSLLEDDREEERAQYDLYGRMERAASESTFQVNAVADGDTFE